MLVKNALTRCYVAQQKFERKILVDLRGDEGEGPYNWVSLDEESDQGEPASTSPPCQPESYVPVSMRMDVWIVAESEEAHKGSPSTRVVIQIGGPSWPLALFIDLPALADSSSPPLLRGGRGRPPRRGSARAPGTPGPSPDPRRLGDSFLTGVETLIRTARSARVCSR